MLSVSGKGKKAVTVPYLNKTDRLLVPVEITGVYKIEPSNAYLAVVTLLSRVSIDLGGFKRQLNHTGEIRCFAQR